jgi:hypothetical protein
VYARPSTWSKWQEKETAILCLRPGKKRGLPLSVLHDVFRQFQLEVAKPLSTTPPPADALEAAFLLCETMGDHFADETKRGCAFENCIKKLLSLEWRHEHRIIPSSEGCSASIDGCYMDGGVLCIIREDKIEAGEAHDAYMQAARGFQMYVSQLRDNGSPLLERGAPTFILLLIGKHGIYHLTIHH